MILHWLSFALFVIVASSLWRLLWPSYDPPMIPTWDYPEHLTADDREWISKHLALTGWSPPAKPSSTDSIAIGRGATAITSTPYNPLNRPSPISEQKWYEQAMERAERTIVRAHSIPPARIGPAPEPEHAHHYVTKEIASCHCAGCYGGELRHNDHYDVMLCQDCGYELSQHPSPMTASG